MYFNGNCESLYICLHPLPVLEDFGGCSIIIEFVSEKKMPSACSKGDRMEETNHFDLGLGFRTTAFNEEASRWASFWGLFGMTRNWAS